MRRRKFTANFKTKVVLEALKERESLTDLSQKHKLSPNQISKWKSEFLSGAPQIFSGNRTSAERDIEQERDRLLRTIGELKVENDYLKKNLK